MSSGPSRFVIPLTIVLGIIGCLCIVWNYHRPDFAYFKSFSLNSTYFVSYADQPQDTLDECSSRALIGPTGDFGSPRGRKVYIDLGANDGSSLKYFFEEFSPDKLGGEKDLKLNDWEAYLFELNPLWKNDLQARCESYPQLVRCDVILAGAWNATKSIGYFHDTTVHDRTDRKDVNARKDKSVGTSLYDRKYMEKKEGEWKTDGCVIDFIEWIRRVILDGYRQTVFLKVDIEGSE